MGGLVGNHGVTSSCLALTLPSMAASWLDGISPSHLAQTASKSGDCSSDVQLFQNSGFLLLGMGLASRISTKAGAGTHAPRTRALRGARAGSCSRSLP